MAMNIKVPTTELIKLVENRIEELNKEIAEYPKKRAEYNKAREKYQTEVAKFALDFIKKNPKAIGWDYQDDVRISLTHKGVSFEFDSRAIPNFPDAPEQPQAPNERRHFGRDWTTPLEALEGTLKALKLTSQQEVSQSTYGSVLGLL